MVSVQASSSRRRVLGVGLMAVAIAIVAAWLLLRPKRGDDSIEPIARPIRTEASAIELSAETGAPRVAAEMPRNREVDAAAAEPVAEVPRGTLAGFVAFTDGSVPPPVLLKLVRYEDEPERLSATDSKHAADLDCVHEIHVPTDAQGHFEAAGLCPGRYRAEAVLPQTMYANGLFEVPTRDARYVFPCYLLIARTVDSSHAPIRGVHVAVEYQQDPDSNRPEPGVAKWSRVTDLEGSFWLALPEPGDVRLRVLGLGPDAPVDVVSLRQTPGVVRRDIWLPVVPDRASLRVQLTACGSNGVTIRDYCFLLREAGSSSEALRLCSETADADVFRSIPPGRYRVMPIARSFGRAPAYYRESPDAGWDIVLEAGHEALLAQCLDLGGRVRLLVRPDASRPSSETAEVDLLSEDGNVVRRVDFREPQPSGGLRVDFTLPMGVERLTDTLLDPGPHMLRVRATGHADHVVRVEVVPGEATALVVDLAAAK